MICVGLLCTFISCGGVAGGGGSTPPPVVVTPGLATLFANVAGNSWPAGVTQQKFLANQSVTWAVTGGSANGTVDGGGLYTAPAVVPNPATVTVTATAVGGAAHGDAVTLIVQ